MEKNNQITRRKFIRNTVFSSAALPLFGGLSSGHAQPSRASAQLDIHIFSKHLQFLDHKDMAEAAAEIGFDGVDLTVRPKGHVLPDQVEDSLPKAVEFIRKNGRAHHNRHASEEHVSQGTDREHFQITESCCIIPRKHR